MCIGRTSKKLNYYDSMDIFLDKLQKDNGYDLTMKKHTNYYSWLSKYKQFSEKHFLASYNTIQKIKYIEENAEELRQQAMRSIYSRAKMISESKLSYLLWEYFNKLGLIE